MTDTAELTILGISGSLRKGSFNTALLRAATTLAPPGMHIALYDELALLPPYDEDVRAQGFPAIVAQWRERIRQADGLLIATPEYNRSIPGVLKNAIDWASRPPEQPFAGKPAAVIGATPGAVGTALAQYHLRQVLAAVDVTVLPGAELMVGAATAKFDEQGQLTDEPTRQHLARYLTRLRDLVQQRRRMPEQ
ncbi:NADPH-dependent FMN reductase [Gluconacetobacter tumulisoli]|uniref:NAD(P)H-dependent oxidoreductase n=1 Tax=Gluconacetobacter tumulisoli TaxID=1286189 RepID=A0A7W4K4M5_9PROT|nr:NADPH-dependent FMN reductase [Gluconacetobacter tumulisoli]MBB2200117.1 NAD(P)H-dependent oxidoreductase [Gluconacetobacter tumulisoli]